jgi:phenylalanyl-tRNA synthetase alpha chain
MINIDELKEKALIKIKEATSLKELDDIKINYLGKKGEITAVMQTFKDMAEEDRKKLGKIINDAKTSIDELIRDRQKAFNIAILNEKLKREAIDVTLPSKKIGIGHLHPCTIVFNDVRDIFEKMGYTVVTGPEIEYDEYNFEKLNIEKGHPARDEQDTFYINDKVLLRTQTSPVQARVMEKGKLPICIISAGRVFRSDSVDATHSPTFHQIEGLVVSDNISFADLKGTLTTFAKSFFGEDIKTRFRPHHFPFTEPSAEMDVSCFKCGGKGCSFCKGEGWIEILGCGMVNPRVYELCGLDKDKCQGFAFGMGIERLGLLKYEIDDMRLLYENDVRFLSQFD